MIREYLITASILLACLGMYELGRMDGADDARREVEMAAASMDAAGKAMDRCVRTLERVATWMN